MVGKYQLSSIEKNYGIKNTTVESLASSVTVLTRLTEQPYRELEALIQEDPEAEFRFFGGDLMTAVGGTRVKHYKELAYMGFIPVLLHLRTIFRNMKECKQDIVRWAPDVVILVDYPGFNLKIAEFIKKQTQIPVYYYISPKIWAWKEYRIKNIKRDVDELFSILPFEIEFFCRTSVPCSLCG